MRSWCAGWRNRVDEEGRLRLRRSRAQEKRDAKDHGGRMQPRSGAGKFAKGDVRTVDLLIENKRTDKESLVIQGAWLDKIRSEAYHDGRVPMIGVDINGREWVMLPKDDYLLDPVSHGGT